MSVTHQGKDSLDNVHSSIVTARMPSGHMAEHDREGTMESASLVCGLQIHGALGSLA